jgi:hypothetical protein
VKTVARELGRRDIAANVAGPRGIGQQVSDQYAESLLRSGDVFTSMRKCRKFGAVVLVGSERRRGNRPTPYNRRRFPIYYLCLNAALVSANVTRGDLSLAAANISLR